MGWHACLIHKFGSLLQTNSFKLVTILTLCLLILSSALKSYKLETNLSSWIQKTNKIESELNYINSINFNYNHNNAPSSNPSSTNSNGATGSSNDLASGGAGPGTSGNIHHQQQQQGQGSTSELILQTPKKNGQNVLTIESMKTHLEALAIATHVTVDMYDVSWSLKDICFTPTVPIFEFAGLKVDDIMNNLMPCVIKTPLDCFWDGAKLLGPDQPAISLGPLGRNLQWTTLNPKMMIEKLMGNYPDSYASYSNLLDWMDSVGISNGYQDRPCLEPSDPKCPLTAPNKFDQVLVSSASKLNSETTTPSIITTPTTNKLHNQQSHRQQVINANNHNKIGAYLTGGCKGFASNLMHWREEEILGGLKRNKSGFITHADAIQSSIILMGEHDLYEYWRNMRKVLDINDWSINKARNIISSWQERFSEELRSLTATTATTTTNNANKELDSATINQSQQLSTNLINAANNIQSDEQAEVGYHNQFNIYAMTSNSQLEPIDELTLINSDNFILSLFLMTLFTCLSYPKFEIIGEDSAKLDDGNDRDDNPRAKKNLDELEKQMNDTISITNTSESRDKSLARRCPSVFVVSKFKTILLALTGSVIVMLTFVASLGLSTFFNFPINMATAQLLPPIALYYGFNQLNMIANIYSLKLDKLSRTTLSSNTNHTKRKDKTTKGSQIIRECLNEISPVIMIESVSYMIALAVASLIPIQATRTFAYQAIIFIILMTISAFTLIPAILHALLVKHIALNTRNRRLFPSSSRSSSSLSDYKSKQSRNSRVHPSPTITNQDEFLNEEQLLSRIQEDLKHIRADTIDETQYSQMNPSSNRYGDINFSAHFDVNGLQTSLRISTSGSLEPSLQQQQSDITTKQFAGSSLSSHPKSINPSIELNKGSQTKQTAKNFNSPPMSQTITSLPDIIASSMNNHQSDDILPKKHKLQQSFHETGDDELILKPSYRASSEDSKDLNDSPNNQSTLEKTNTGNQELDVDQYKIRKKSFSSKLLDLYATGLTECKLLQLLICFLSILTLAIVISYCPKVNYGIQLSSIIDRDSDKYEPLLSQEKHFPIYNIFIVTKGNFDYASNQKLLNEFYKAFENIDGIIRDEDSSIKPKFWLFAFREWLISLQEKYDQDKNKSLITSEGWAQDVSDTTKLAYKLLAQTGRPDNPIDRSIVETNRLVDNRGIINIRAFYYYLTAWVMSDSFTYAVTEANLKPELKSWNADLDDLKIEKARPIIYAQIPFIMKLPGNHNNLKTISEVRRISQAYESVLPNFPTGIPFIFWDQFFNLDLTFFGSLTVGIMIMFFVIAFLTSDFVIAAISVIPMTSTSLELYGFLGYMSIPFNNILAVLVIMSLGLSIIQTVHLTTFFKYKEGDLITRTKEALKHRVRVVITSLTLLILCALVFLNSKMDFMIGYAFLLLFLTAVNIFNSLLLTPVLLSLFGSKYTTCEDENESQYNDDENNTKIEFSNSKKERSTQNRNRNRHLVQCSGRSKNSRQKKTRCYLRVQSNISLSTISEESLSGMESPELKIEISSKR